MKGKAGIDSVTALYVFQNCMCACINSKGKLSHLFIIIYKVQTTATGAFMHNGDEA